jgi:hypothetical protein
MKIFIPRPPFTFKPSCAGSKWERFSPQEIVGLKAWRFGAKELKVTPKKLKTNELVQDPNKFHDPLNQS